MARFSSSGCELRTLHRRGGLLASLIVAASASIALSSPLIQYGNVAGINRGTDACKPDDVYAALKQSGFLIAPVDLNVRGIGARVPFKVEENREVGTHGYTRDGGQTFHAGTDFLGDKGESVVAVVAGKVISAGYEDGLGNFAFLRTDVIVPPALPCAVDFVYAHLQSVPKTGNIRAGDEIGKIGRSGRQLADACIPTRLHIELWAGAYRGKDARAELTRDIMGLFQPY